MNDVTKGLLEALKAAQSYVCGPTAWTQEQEDTLVEAMSKAIARAESTLAEPKPDADVQEAAKIIAKQAIAAEAERDALAAKLAELEGQDPVAWVEVVSTHEGPYNFEGMALLGKGNHLLYARPVPAEMSPEFTDTARSALLWVLWHHQGGSSPVGQPIRYALGMDAHERLSEHQVQEAKRWAALTKSESTDFRQARTAPPEPVNARLLDALKRAKNSIVAFKFVPGGANCWEASDEENLTAVNSAIAAAEAAHTEPVNVDFGKRGENMFFKIDNQSFLLEYKPEEQDEFDFMKAMLLSAFSRITHGVKTEIQPVNTRLLTALKACRNKLAHYAAMVAMADVAIMAAEAAPRVCESRQTPGTGSVAILQGAADAILARGQK